MRTVNELKKLPASKLQAAIDNDRFDSQTNREIELNDSYMKRNTNQTEVPDFIVKANETLALHFAIGGLQTLLRLAIKDLQTAEAKLESLEHADSKWKRVSLDEWKEKVKGDGIR